MSAQPNYSKFTEKEIRFVRLNYLTMTDNDLAGTLNRSPKGVKKIRLKAGLLKMEHPDEPGSKTRNLFRKQEIRLLKRFIKTTNLPICHDIARQRIEYLESIVSGKK